MSTPAGVAVPQRPVRRLDRKLSNIAAGRYTPDDFVIADAKDADMAFGVTSAGPVTSAPAGTTRDTFELLQQAERHGARVALFGRKIQRAESQLDLVGLMRPVLRRELSPADAVRAYHDALAKAEITPQRSLEADLEVTDPVLRSE